MITTVRTTLTTMQNATGKKNEKLPLLTEMLPGSWVTPDARQEHEHATDHQDHRAGDQEQLARVTECHDDTLR